MLYATITNIVAYLPLLLLTGNVGLFLYSMPVVLTCSLIAALVVSKTLIPLLSYYLLRPSRKPPVPLEERRHIGFAGWYYRVGRGAIRHRWRVAVASLALPRPGRLDHEPAQAPVLPQGPPVPLVCRGLAAGGRAAQRDPRGRPTGWRG